MLMLVPLIFIFGFLNPKSIYIAFMNPGMSLFLMLIGAVVVTTISIEVFIELNDVKDTQITDGEKIVEKVLSEVTKRLSLKDGPAENFPPKQQESSVFSVPTDTAGKRRKIIVIGKKGGSW